MEDVLYFGQSRYGWATQWYHATRDAKDKTITTVEDSYYGASIADKPFRIYNAFESFVEPGEWYYDTKTDKFYIYPFEDTTANSRLYITQNSFDMISVYGASYVSIEGITITSSSQRGVVMENADNCVINNCVLNNFVNNAVRIDASTNCGIKNSHIAFGGYTLIYVNGGDWETMTPGNNFISNNIIHDGNKYRVSDIATVRLCGVATRFDHNEVYNTMEQAVQYAHAGSHDTSVNAIIENNIFHDVCINGKDMAAVYGGRDARCQGLIVRNNLFYNIGNADPSFTFTVAAFYADDGLSGLVFENNIIGPGMSGPYTKGFINNSGHNNIYRNNLLIDVPNITSMTIDDARLLTSMRESTAGYGQSIGPTMAEVWQS